jgi:hypothetical protein
VTEHRSFEHLLDNQLSAPRDLIELRYIDRQHELLGMFPLAEAGAVVTERLFLLERLRSFPDLHPGQRFLSELVRHRGSQIGEEFRMVGLMLSAGIIDGVEARDRATDAAHPVVEKNANCSGPSSHDVVDEIGGFDRHIGLRAF